MTLLDNVLPVLRVAQAATAGNPVPGLEGAINGVVALAEMVSTMKGNKADLPELDKRLKQLTEIDKVECSNDLKQRLDTLKKNLEAVTPRLISLGKKSKSKEYGKELQDIKASIASHIQDFTFHNKISIKIILDQISTSQENPRPTKEHKLNDKMADLDQVDTSLQRMEPQGRGAKSQSVDNHGDQQGPGGGDRGQGQNLTVNNYISGGTGGPGGWGFAQGTGGGGGSGEGPTLNYTINKVENFTTGKVSCFLFVIYSQQNINHSMSV